MDALTNHPPLRDRLALDHEILSAEIAAALENVAVPEIASDDDVVAAREIVKPLKALQDRVTVEFRAEKDPIVEAGRTVEGFFKEMRAKLDEVVAAITANATAYQTKKREDTRKLEAAKARIAAAVGEAAPAPVAPKETTRVSTATGVAASGRVTWDYEVTDAAQLPRELLMPNKDAIKAKVAGLKATVGDISKAAIPGVRIFEKVGTTWR